MRKIIIILLLLPTQIVFAQGTRMSVKLKSGTTMSYDVDSISSLNFAQTDTLPKYSKIYIHAYTSTASPDDYVTSKVDSLIFHKDTYPYERLDIYPEALPPFSSSYRLIGPHTFGYNAPTDSITFKQFQFDTNVINLTSQFYSHLDCGIDKGGLMLYHCAIWNGDRILAEQPYRFFDLDSKYNIIYDSTLCPTTFAGLAFSADPKQEKVLDVASHYPDVSIGSLSEYDRLKGVRSLVFGDLDTNVSSAQYYGEDSILYFSYGNSFTPSNRQPPDQGYYFYNRNSGVSSFFLPFVSKLGPSEMVNGFDISPDKKKLLIAVTDRIAIPFLIEYEFSSRQLDTLRVNFDSTNSRNRALWVRYSHDGTKILYSNYPTGTFTGGLSIVSGSEVGIIDRTTLTKTILHTNPSNEHEWVSIFPSWSSDDKHIVYCSSFVLREPLGDLSAFQVCILKKLH